MLPSRLSSSVIDGRRKVELVNKPRRRSSKNHGFDYRQAAAVLRPELLALLPDRDCDEILPFEREPLPSEAVGPLHRDAPQ